MTASHPVSCAQIQSELSRIWDCLEGANKMRASLFNLIFYCKKNHRFDYIRKIAKKVIEKFPSRIILVSLMEGQDEDLLEASVSVISPENGKCDVACDFIEIRVSSSQKTRIPFVVLPHILPDLPVYLLLAEDPTMIDPISKQLEKWATRVIFDSECTNQLSQFARSVIDQKKQSHFDIADLNWARLESWRDLLSQNFHSSERLRELENAHSITICYNAQETISFCHVKIQSIYLQAWLAGQLNWNFSDVQKEKDSLIFHYKKEQQTITIILNPVKNADAAPGSILSFELKTHEKNHFLFGRDAKFSNLLTVQISTPEICELPAQFLFGKTDAGQSLVKEICHKGTSSHYLKVLNLITKLDECTIC